MLEPSTRGDDVGPLTETSESATTLQMLLLSQLLSAARREEADRMEALRNDHRQLASILASIDQALVTTDTQGRVEVLNPAAEQLLGWQAAEARGRLSEDVVVLEHGAHGEALEDLRPCLELGQRIDLGELVELVRQDGTRVAIEGTISPLRWPNEDSEIGGTVWVLHDVSDRRQKADRLTRAASFDALTGLLNQKAFDRHVQEAFDHAVLRATNLELVATSEEVLGNVLCHIDLDQFKVVNDTCGHAAGDMLLQWIASLIRERLGHDDVLARIGGDEFGLLIADTTVSKAQSLAEEIHAALKKFRFVWQDKSFSIGISLGMVPVEPDFEELADLLGAAERACYLAKLKGRGQTQLYERDADEIRRYQGQMNWVVKIQQALDEDQFELHWQRIHPVAPRLDGPYLFFEVLVRLRTRSGQLVSPGEFLPTAERFGLMPDLDRWVLRNTLDTLRQQPAEFLDRLECCSINLSGASIGDAAMLDFVHEELTRTGFPGRQICLEITETAAVSNLHRAVEMIEQLRRRECRWALDDFGSGMSSYRYLRELPVDFVKIDGKIVADLDTSPLSRAMVQSIHQISHVIEARTIAETVHSAEILAVLEEIGVDYAQGYWLARPQAIAEAERSADYPRVPLATR